MVNRWKVPRKWSQQQSGLHLECQEPSGATPDSERTPGRCESEYQADYTYSQGVSLTLGWGLWVRLLDVGTLVATSLWFCNVENFSSKSFPVPPLPHRLWRGVPGSLACWQQEGAPTTNASRYGIPRTVNASTL